MESLTPGRKLILDLLTQSVAKIQAAEAKNETEEEKVSTDERKGKRKIKRESTDVPLKLRKIKAENKLKVTVDASKRELKVVLKPDNIKSEHDAEADVKRIRVKREEENKFGRKDIFKCFDKESKTEDLKKAVERKGAPSNVLLETPTTLDRIKVELKTEELKNENRKKRKNNENVLVDTKSVKVKSEYAEIKTEEMDLKSYAKPEIKDNELARSSISSIVKNENNKDSIKVDDYHDVKSKLKAEIFVEITKVEDVKQREPLNKSLKKKDLRVDSTQNKDLISKHESNVLLEGHTRDHTIKQNYKRKSGFSAKHFTREEDQIILEAIEEFGDNVDVTQMAEDLQRTVSSIRNEVRKLKAGKEKKKPRKYTLPEDLVILDAVLENLGEHSLKLVNFTQSEWREIGAQIGKGPQNVRSRWDVLLRPWILQHFAGTRNLDLKRPLANYLAENFHDVNSIDWSSVASQPEFAGHTQLSLRKYFSSHLYRAKLHKDGADITLELIAEFANTKYAEGRRKIPDSVLKRQEEIIDYFENYVKSNGIRNFL